MQKHFVRTIFWGCTQNLHLATRLIYITYILRMHVYVIPNTNVPCALYVGQKGPNTLLRRPFMFLSNLF